MAEKVRRVFTGYYKRYDGKHIFFFLSISTPSIFLHITAYFYYFAMIYQKEYRIDSIIQLSSEEVHFSRKFEP